MSRKKTWIALGGAVALGLLLLAGRPLLQPPEPPPPPVAPAPVPPSIGFIDQPVDEILASSEFVVSGWALDQAGVSAVEAVLDGEHRFPLRYGVTREDVAATHGGFPDGARAGFEGRLDLSRVLGSRHDLAIEVVNAQGRRTPIGRKTVIAMAAAAADLPADLPPEAQFFVLMATSGVAAGGAAEIGELYAPMTSRTMKVGMRVPILYLRTTRGRTRDWAFDPDFDTSRRCGDKVIAEDSLNGVITYAIEKQLPVLFTLNGGVWADATCDAPEWDVNDALEQSVGNCQWNERNEVFADDHLEHLPGSAGSPQLARALTLNVHAGEVRRYKKRNLQQAGRLVQRFAREHPHLFVGINLDPDVYMNPFFESPKHWHDYNPRTLRQFREWLRGSGPYAGGGRPDLSAYRRSQPLTLREVNRLAGRQWTRWSQVDPPRDFPASGEPPVDDPWFREWERFRRHLVDLHYDELSEWLVEAGVEKRFIFSSQGFLAHPVPFPVTLDSPPRNFDSAGVTIEGAVPRQGHLGAILYGKASVNTVPMEGRDSLFAAFRRHDPAWAVVEHNTADFRAPAELPGFAEGYRSLRDTFNYGARFLSPMAWNGSNGIYAGQPGFAAFTAIRNTPLEEAVREFLVSHANFPRGGRLWAFGAPRHPSDDGWRAETGGLQPLGGRVELTPAGAEGAVVLLSPEEIAAPVAAMAHLFLRGPGVHSLRSIGVQGLDAESGEWIVLRAERTVDPLPAGEDVLRLPFEAGEGRVVERLRISLRFANGTTLPRLDRIGLWPRLPGTP